MRFTSISLLGINDPIVVKVKKKLHAAEEHSCYSVYGQVF